MRPRTQAPGGQAPRDGPRPREGPGARDGPPDSDPDPHTLIRQFLAWLGITLEPIARTCCDHRDAESGLKWRTPGGRTYISTPDVYAC